MKRLKKSIQGLLVFVVIIALSGCSTGAAETPVATAAEVNINDVMTAAAATAFVQLTQIAALPSLTARPSLTPTPEPATNTPVGEANSTEAPSLQQLTLTPTEGAGGLPDLPSQETQTPVPGGALPTSPVIPSLTALVPVVPPSTGSTCLNSAFIADVTIEDKTVLKPGQKFRKVWRIQNTGTCSWDEGFGLVGWSNPMGGSPAYYSGRDQPVAPGGIVDIGIDMVAPSILGDQIGHWQMVSDSGLSFGTDLTVYIIVAP